MASARRPDPAPAAQELTEGTRLGEVYMRSLIRAQLRHAVSVLVPVGLLLAALPLLFVVRPDLNDVRLLTVPLPWLVLGVAVYPLLLLAAWRARSLAENAEQVFTEILQQPDAADPDGRGEDRSR
ncbi:MAG: hypothetical protein U0Q15_07880 [Kineosporiaceae bacterium]